MITRSRGMSITTWLIIINVSFFILSFFAVSLYPNFFNYVALKPADFFQGKKIWTLITSMFAHAGIAHLFANMISLFFIGMFVEKLIGRKRFLSFYILAGLFAGIFFSALSFLFGSGILGSKIFGDPNVLAMGASGAIFGLVGLLAVLTPYNKIYLITGPLIALIVQALLQAVFNGAGFTSILDLIVNVYFIFSIFAIFSINPRIRKIAIPLELSFWMLPFISIIPLIIIGLFFSLPIGNMAHLGGLIAGLAYGLYLKRKYPKKTRMISQYFR